MIGNLFFILVGLFGGLWIVWPGIVTQENWICAKDIVIKSQREQVDIRAALAVSPKYLIKRKKLGTMDKIRVVGDACFR